MNRRQFVSSVALGGAALSFGSTLRSAEASKPPLRLGIIGCGWFGGVNYEAFCRVAEVRVVSICDPNARHLERTKKLISAYQSDAPLAFADYRKMLEAEPLDVVIVATPDHWHALPAIDAMKAGADVYLEKPVGVDVLEGEALLATAREYNRIVQVNTQRRSNPFYVRMAEEFLQGGRLGKVGLVECFSYLGLEGWRPGSIPDAEVPEHLNYELWAGPAPKLPYKAIMEDRGWRAFMEYGNGVIGNLGVHTIDKVRWLLGLGWPESVSATGLRYHEDSFSNVPDTMNCVLQYPDLNVSWEHRMWGKSPIPERHWSDQWGARFMGSGGTLTVTMFEYVFEPADGGPTEGVHMLSQTGDLENVDFGATMPAYQEVENQHVLDFLGAREERGSRLPIADIEQGHISSACCVLGNLSLDLGRPLAYDAKTRSVKGDVEATGRLARSYRDEWIHPGKELGV
ncbi:Gfo/Idh/MocA family oxidoreductase [Pelagicoccus sp. SDUM812003]|uniref:Gfo/Idh/MocA family protein n=1 Tax=Pelagicoccus sp. SDUM812003 TaxID=3041267 RepID=UPI00280FD4B2|nr:Gfo/Idh/MocA family oxidoreductase [Pelagicoccus sp. SDUM812003]MDQ8203830.1 Gfo/Idh/MocA family oxidoreductase [Pelagicoccus sp. SDUM812003]